MTSNVGSDHIQEMSERGAADFEIELQVREELKRHFRPEFLNRIDETIIFHRLEKQELRQIVEIQIERLQARLRDREIDLQMTDAAKDKLAGDGYDPVYGARPLARLIRQHIENPLARRLLAGEFTAGHTVLVDQSGDFYSFTKAEYTALAERN